jgi:glycosyltransferase involved in cell wall biosynthesis
MSLIILTKSPVRSFEGFVRNIKNVVKFLLGRRRGPDVVDESLLKGLRELKFDHKYNVKEKEVGIGDIVYVNRSFEALRWAIEAKKEGKIKKLIVGPNFVVIPDEQNEIMSNPNIDKIIIPCSWVTDFWLSVRPGLKDKLAIWPAGVDLYPVSSQKKDKVLVYQKNADQILLQNIIDLLHKKNVSYEVVTYGSYEHKKYLSLLDRSKMVIFLSKTESQGIAMCEAWMKNVPTLVWDCGRWEHGQYIWKSEKISAPYLTEQCGCFFKDFKDMERVFDDFLADLSHFSPRNYTESNFSNKVVAERFLRSFVI